MARSKNRSRAGRSKADQRGAGGGRVPAWWRWLGGLMLIALVGGAYGWWSLRHWQPLRSAYPMQGALVGYADGDVDFVALKAIGADFVYIEASASAFARDPAVVKNLEAARAARLQVGALHKYDPCQPAEKQAANFVTVVPRDKKMLPPAVELEQVADACPVPVSDAAVVSELMTFLNQIETHTGKPVLLKLGRRFEGQYHVAGALDRGLWLSRERMEPDYGGRGWAMWTANSGLMTSASAQGLRWVVVQK